MTRLVGGDVLAASFSSATHLQLQLRFLLPKPLHPVHYPVPTYPKTATMGSVVLPHLKTGWHVDQAIMSEEDRLVVIRFGRDWDPDCMRQDEVLYRMLLPFPSPRTSFNRC